VNNHVVEWKLFMYYESKRHGVPLIDRITWGRAYINEMGFRYE
jgi:hypothetical protein